MEEESDATAPPPVAPAVSSPPAANSEAILRACRFVRQRGGELVNMRADISRHSRTLCSRTAVEETYALAYKWLRSGGKTVPTADPSDAGHGISTMREVAEEAVSLLRGDLALKGRNDTVRQVLIAEMEPLSRNEPDVTEARLARIKASHDVLQQSSLTDAWAALIAIIENRPKALQDLETVLIASIADARARGYSDENLLSRFQALEDTVSSLKRLAAAIDGEVEQYNCYVAADTTGATASDLRAGGLSPLEKLPFTPTGRPTPRGPYLCIEVEAVEPSDAARIGLRRVEALLGAAAVFLPTQMDVRSRVVVVKGRRAADAVDVNETLLVKERRGITTGQVARVLAAMNRSERNSSSDPIFDAIRYHRKAMQAVDNDSRFMFLWLGIERLLLGSKDHGRILSAARELVSKAITLGKLRSEIGAFCLAIDNLSMPGQVRDEMLKLVGLPGTSGRLDREKVLAGMLAPEEESRKFTRYFYEEDPRLCLWYFRMRKRLGEGKPDALGPNLSKYLKESNLRVEWHMLRLYRTRNQIAHVGRSSIWIRDLVRHAHHYLTQLVAIAVAHREVDSSAVPLQVFINRAGQMELFLAMLEKNDPRAISVKALLRPTSLFGKSP